MNLTTEHLDAIEELASLFFSPEDICINLELSDAESEVLKFAIAEKQIQNSGAASYFKGWFTAEIAMRKAIKQSAMNGSSPSQQIFLNYQRESRT